MLSKNHITKYGRLILSFLMVSWIAVSPGCDSGGGSGDDSVQRVYETFGEPSEILEVNFKRYINGDYVDVAPELHHTSPSNIYNFDYDEDISFEVIAYDPDLDMKEVTITTYDVFDMETGEPTEYYRPPASGPDIHTINWCENSPVCDDSSNSEGFQREETATFYLKNALKLNTGWKGPKQIWITIQDLGNNSSEHYILYARSG